MENQDEENMSACQCQVLGILPILWQAENHGSGSEDEMKSN
jgi:hypothetical protein